MSRRSTCKPLGNLFFYHILLFPFLHTQNLYKSHWDLGSHGYCCSNTYITITDATIKDWMRMWMGRDEWRALKKMSLQRSRRWAKCSASSAERGCCGAVAARWNILTGMELHARGWGEKTFFTIFSSIKRIIFIFFLDLGSHADEAVRYDFSCYHFLYHHYNFFFIFLDLLN